MSLKSFDFFRKIHSQQQLSSATGGFFTIGSLIVAGILVLLSIQDFTSLHYNTSLTVKNVPTEYIPMRVDITFNRAPCELIGVRFHDQLEFMETGLEKKLGMFNVQGEAVSKFQDTEDRDALKNRADQGITKNRGCKLEGILNLPKTPGTLTFDTTGHNNLILQLNPTNRMAVRASYILRKLQFGQALKPFQLPNYIKKLQGNIATRTVIQDFQSKTQRINFYNHLKIIPIYVDDGTYTLEQDKQKYRYSLRSGNAYTRGVAPTLQIFTELEPINIVYTKNNMTFYELCVDILAIAGGSVATIGVINGVFHYLFAGK